MAVKPGHTYNLKSIVTNSLITDESQIKFLMQDGLTPLNYAVISGKENAAKALLDAMKENAAKALLDAMDDAIQKRCLTEKFTVRQQNNIYGCFEYTRPYTTQTRSI